MAEIASIQPECPICLEKDADMCLPCGGYHWVHRSCWKEVKDQEICPMCRQSVIAEKIKPSKKKDDSASFLLIDDMPNPGRNTQRRRGRPTRYNNILSGVIPVGPGLRFSNVNGLWDAGPDLSNGGPLLPGIQQHFPTPPSLYDQNIYDESYSTIIPDIISIGLTPQAEREQREKEVEAERRERINSKLRNCDSCKRELPKSVFYNSDNICQMCINSTLRKCHSCEGKLTKNGICQMCINKKTISCDICGFSLHNSLFSKGDTICRLCMQTKFE